MTVSFCHWKTLAPFCLQKKRPEKCIFNINSELLQNRTEKQIMSFKAKLNWLFNDIRYLIIFQQTVMRGILYP